MKRILFLAAAFCCVTMGFAGEKVKTSTKSVPAAAPSQDIDNKTSITHVYMDTTYTYTTRTVKNEIPQVEDTAFTRKGHYLQALVGLGYSSLGYKFDSLAIGRNAGGGQGSLQLNYVYYFHENWGFLVGLQFQHMTSNAVLNGTYSPNYWGKYYVLDSDPESYQHIVRANNWREAQVTYMLGLPIGIQCQFPVAQMKNAKSRNNQIRLYADLGAKVNYHIASKYHLAGGSISHEGFYEFGNLYLTEKIGTDLDFYTENAGEGYWTKDKKDLNISKISVDGFADFGVMIPLKEHLDLMVGVYANYTFNDLHKEDPESEASDLGWANPTWQNTNQAYREHAFMEEYKGIINSKHAAHAAMRPWDVGIKVGISWNTPARKPKKYETLVMRDTTYTLERREEVENIPMAAKKINEIMKKSVIWFDFDSDKPKLQPADVVDKIAAVLLEHPEQMVLVYGHASKEGSLEYNQRLSERRAASIVRLLKKKGVPAAQIVSKGFSYTQQYDDSENPYHNIALDRRVEIIPVFEKDRINE